MPYFSPNSLIWNSLLFRPFSSRARRVLEIPSLDSSTLINRALVLQASLFWAIKGVPEMFGYTCCLDWLQSYFLSRNISNRLIGLFFSWREKKKKGNTPNNPSLFSTLPAARLVCLLGFTTEHGFIIRVCPDVLESAWSWWYKEQQPQEVPFPKEIFRTVLPLSSFLCLLKCKLWQATTPW